MNNIQNYLSYISDHKFNFITIMQMNQIQISDSFTQYTSKVARKLLDEVLNVDEIDVRYHFCSDEQKIVLRSEVISLRSLCRVYLDYLHQNGHISDLIIGE